MILLHLGQKSRTAQPRGPGWTSSSALSPPFHTILSEKSEGLGLYHSSDGKLTPSGNRADPLSHFLLPLSGNPQFPSRPASVPPAPPTAPRAFAPWQPFRQLRPLTTWPCTGFMQGGGVSCVTQVPISPFSSPPHNVPSCPHLTPRLEPRPESNPPDGG